MISPKQQRFCEEYIKDLNGSEAAIRAGYSKKTARNKASNLLDDPAIVDYLQQLQKKVAERNNITVDELIQDLIEIKNINIATLYDKEGKLRNINELPKSFTKCIQEVYKTKTGIKYKFYSRLDAIEKLARHLGFYEKDNSQSKPEFTMHLPYEIKIESRKKADS